MFQRGACHHGGKNPWDNCLGDVRTRINDNAVCHVPLARMAEKAPRLLNINGLDRQHMMLFVRKGTAYTLARRWTCASFHTCTISCSAPRTVLLNAQERVSVAQVLQEHCSNEAGSFVVARDEDGVPFSLGDMNYRI